MRNEGRQSTATSSRCFRIAVLLVLPVVLYQLFLDSISCQEASPNVATITDLRVVVAIFYLRGKIVSVRGTCSSEEADVLLGALPDGLIQAVLPIKLAKRRQAASVVVVGDEGRRASA